MPDLRKLFKLDRLSEVEEEILYEYDFCDQVSWAIRSLPKGPDYAHALSLSDFGSEIIETLLGDHADIVLDYIFSEEPEDDETKTTSEPDGLSD